MRARGARKGKMRRGKRVSAGSPEAPEQARSSHSTMEGKSEWREGDTWIKSLVVGFEMEFGLRSMV